MRIYLAAPWDLRNTAREWGQRLEEAGHVITHKWWDHESSMTGYEEDAKEPFKKMAEMDVEAVMSCDHLILWNAQARGYETSGKAVETGIAIATRKPISMVGGWSNVFHFLPSVKWFDSIEAVMEAL